MASDVRPTRSGKSLLRLTHIFTILSFVITLGTGLAAWWIVSARAQAEMPDLGLTSLMSDVRAYHSLDGAFPVDLAKLQEKVWIPRGKELYQLTEESHSYVAGNYYYLYTALGPHEASFWAVPLGKYRTRVSSYYVKILHNESIPTIWQGPALDYEQVKKIRGAMTDIELINLGMQLQNTPAQSTPAQTAPGQTAPAATAPSKQAPAKPKPPSDSPFRFSPN